MSESERICGKKEKPNHRFTPLDSNYMNYFYIYILQSKKDNKFYTGYTSDLKVRLAQHNNGEVESTKNRRPLELVYFEGCKNKQDAIHREKYLETS